MDNAELTEFEPTILKKLLVKAYIEQKIANSETLQEHFHIMVENVEFLKAYLNEKKSTSALWVGGSFANGKSNTLYSDLDYYFGIRYTSQPSEINQAINTFQSLDQIGMVINDKDRAIKAIEEVVTQGEGVARIDAITEEGIGVDIHCLGELDLRRICFLFPGKIRRIDSVESYNQLRVSFAGEKKLVKVSERFIKNYFTDIVPLKGIYLDNLSAGAVLIHDHENYGQNISDQIWIAIVKGYISQ